MPRDILTPSVQVLAALLAAVSTITLAQPSSSAPSSSTAASTPPSANNAPEPNADFDALLRPAIDRAASLPPDERITSILLYIHRLPIPFAERRRLSKYASDRSAAESEARIARKKGEAAARIAATTVKINQANLTLIAQYEHMRKNGRFVDKDLEYLKEIYVDEPTSQEVRSLIQLKFGDLFDFKTLVGTLR